MKLQKKVWLHIGNTRKGLLMKAASTNGFIRYGKYGITRIRILSPSGKISRPAFLLKKFTFILQGEMSKCYLLDPRPWTLPSLFIVPSGANASAQKSTIN